jgi:hypothetical protein
MRQVFIENHNSINPCLIGRDASNWKSFILYVVLDIVSCSAVKCWLWFVRDDIGDIS